MSVPAAVSTAEIFLSTRSVWAEMSPSMSLLVMGSRAVCPAQKTNSPALMAWEYGPIGLGASFTSTTERPFAAAYAFADFGFSAEELFGVCPIAARNNNTAAKQVSVFIDSPCYRRTGIAEAGPIQMGRNYSSRRPRECPFLNRHSLRPECKVIVVSAAALGSWKVSCAQFSL